MYHELRKRGTRTGGMADKVVEMQSNEKTLRSAAELAAAGLVARESLPDLERVAARYAVAITPAVVELIPQHDAADPMARQFVPDPSELESRPEELADPIGDDAHSPLEGIVHRYPDRVLLMLTHVCATYCRFCFRRETVGPQGASMLSRPAREAALDYIAQHEEIWEVILSVGDPRIVTARRLAPVMARQSANYHTKDVRVTTRLPHATRELV